MKLQRKKENVEFIQQTSTDRTNDNILRQKSGPRQQFKSFLIMEIFPRSDDQVKSMNPFIKSPGILLINMVVLTLQILSKTEIILLHQSRKFGNISLMLLNFSEQSGFINGPTPNRALPLDSILSLPLSLPTLSRICYDNV